MNKKIKTNNKNNKGKDKNNKWVIFACYFISYWILVFGASTVIVPYLVKIFLFYGQDVECIVFYFIVCLFIIGSSMGTFIKIVDMVDVKNNLLTFFSITLMSIIITLSMIPITIITVDDYNQVKKQEYKLNKLFCDRYPTECLNN